jgi:hypothetical protein
MSKKNGLAAPTRLKPFDADDKRLLRVVIETQKEVETSSPLIRTSTSLN